VTGREEVRRGEREYNRRDWGNAMSAIDTQVQVRGIEQDPARCGGYPVIAGTRTAVRHLVEHLRVNGGSVDTLLEAFPHLTRAQVEDALVYYIRFPQLVDEDIERNRLAWERLTGTTCDGHPVVP
jgi:uncharacterized protein (DUF433 family)